MLAEQLFRRLGIYLIIYEIIIDYFSDWIIFPFLIHCTYASTFLCVCLGMSNTRYTNVNNPGVCLFLSNF